MTREKVLQKIANGDLNFQETNLRGADLQGADLWEADLQGANLKEANLRGADLQRANLREADLQEADLQEADLQEADLWGADLQEANLKKTVLDPDSAANNEVEKFEKIDETFVIGYRTREAGHIDKYRDGRIYSAYIFSTCKVTECHPGLYLWPTLEEAEEFSGANYEYIKVKAPAKHVHKAGEKWRCRWFEVLGGV